MPNPVALKDPKAGAETVMGAGVATLTIVPQNFGEVMAFAEKMAASRFVPMHLRDKPADCLVVCLQALRWGFDPFAVAQKTYFIKDGSPPAYEAQLVNAVVLARAPLVGRPKITWAGNWPNRTCTVSGLFQGDSEPKARTVNAVNIKVRNSPLWLSDPDQQIAYYATRAWARLYCPDVLMGVYTPDDDDMRAERATDVTGSAEQPRAASRLDAMERGIAGEPEATLVEPTQDNPFGFPEHEGPEGGQIELPTQPGAHSVTADEAADRAEAWANRWLAKIQDAKSVAALTKWKAEHAEEIEQCKAANLNSYGILMEAVQRREREIGTGPA